MFFDKLRVYLNNTGVETKLNKNLRVHVYRVLEHFLEVMAIAHKLTTGHKGRVKLAFKVTIFGEDEGIRAALHKLETLVAHVTSLEISVIANDLSDAARNILSIDRKLDQVVDAQEMAVSQLTQLQTAEERRSDAETTKKETELIRKVLRIKENSQPWQDVQEDLWRFHVEGSGRWLLDRHSMQRYVTESMQEVQRCYESCSRWCYCDVQVRVLTLMLTFSPDGVALRTT